ncbi:MAG: RimK/LysX family protein [Pirellulaceae bacterium]
MKKIVVGWREYIHLPELFSGRIKCKVDTGAASSSLHAKIIGEIDQELEDGTTQSFIRFGLDFVEPVTGKAAVERTAPLLEYRKVRSSNGIISRRPVIIVNALMHGVRWPIEVTLADREKMGFPMLLGREALRGRFLVDPQRSYWLKKQNKA